MYPSTATADVSPAARPALPLRLLQGFERGLIVFVLAAMAVLPVLEILGRRFFDAGVPGGILYTQHLTLWAGFLGALLATGKGKHLALATGELIPAGRLRNAARIYVGGLSAAVAALFARAAWVMVQADTARRATLPGGVPEWWSELVMPAALALMAVRFVLAASPRGRDRLAALALAAALAATGLFESFAGSLVVPGAVVILVGLLAGAPVFVAMAGMAMLLFFSDGVAVAAVPTETYRLVASSTLPAIPLLTVAGYILAEGGASKRLLRFARALVGWAPGGLAVVVVLVLAVFTTFTGGSGVTILALGGLVLPMLVQERYPEGFSLGLVSSAGSLGLLFPPSMPVILYAVVAGAGVADLYLAGLFPGLLMLALVAVYAMWQGHRAETPRQPFVLREALAATWEAKWELAIPAVVVTAIFTGWATMVEAAAVAVGVAVVVECGIFRDLSLTRELPGTLVRAATLVGAVVILLGVAMGLTSWLVDAEIPAALLAWTQQHIESPWAFLLVLNAVLLVVGSVLEIYAAIAILAPLLAPMAAAYGIDPIHLGIVFLANLELGFLFPPMGLNLILGSSRFNQPLTRLWKVALPYLAVLAAGVLLITYVPAMTTGFLHWVKPPVAEEQAPAAEEEDLWPDDEDEDDEFPELEF
jgi:C4-dicarboxylate transporter DctM subunit